MRPATRNHFPNREKSFSYWHELGHWSGHCEVTRRSRSRSVGHVAQPGTHSEDAAIVSVEKAFNAALAEAGHFDVLINNAGSGHFGPTENLSEKEIASQFQILVFGQVQLMRLALRVMQARGEGLIINVTSLAGRLPVPFMAAYNAAKAAMASFTMSIQLELPDARVRIVDLQPGDIRTDFNEAVMKSGQNDPRYEAKFAKTWDAVERNVKNAPKPDLVARHVLNLINDVHPPPRITVGDAFQAKVAPLIFRFLPQRVRIWGLKRYYGI